MRTIPATPTPAELQVLMARGQRQRSAFVVAWLRQVRQTVSSLWGRTGHNGHITAH